MINFCEIFISSFNDYREKYTYQVHNSNQKYGTQDIYETLLKFVRNSVYFSRFDDTIDGKYLNKIHNFLCKYDFYGL
jgi:hypothetical protein